MILNGQASQNVIIEGESSVKTAGIDNRKLAKLQYILTTGLYKDGISAVMVELCNNGMDSVIQSGKDPLENPVMVKLFKDTRGHYQLSIQDRGLGMDSEFFENRFMNLLDSTKEEDNNTIGHFGIGGKSWSSLNRSVTFTITKDGKQSKYLCYKGEEFIDFDPLYKDQDTEEENGVLFEMQIQDWSEYSTFQVKAKQKLAYYDTVVLMIDGRVWDNKIYRNELFQWSSNAPSSNLHLCLKDVIYTIDYEKLGISHISLPIALRFDLDSGLCPTPSREDILFNKDSIALIKDKIQKVADFFVEKYNDTVKEFDTFIEAYRFIDIGSHYLTLEGRNFLVDNIKSYSTIEIKEPVIKGITLKSPKYYKDKADEFIGEYEAIAYDNYNNAWKKKQISWELTSVYRDYRNSASPYTRKKVVLYNGNLAGNIKEFLRDRYGSSTVYVEKAKERKLKGNLILAGYNSLLLLDREKKEVWRELIAEWNYVQKSVLDKFFIDESGVESSEEYIEWLEDKKATAKANRSKGIYVGKAINKQEGDIVISYGRVSALDGKTPVFEKKAFPIKDLYKNPYITVYWEDTPENKAIASKYFHLSTPFKVKFALIGRKELAKLPTNHNFMTEKQYQGTKQFRKFVTAMKAKELITIYDSLSRQTQGIIQTLVGKYYDNVEMLRKYIRENTCHYVSTELADSMMVIAEANNLFDHETLIIINEVKKDIERFDFLSALSVPSSWDEAGKKRYKKIINQMLLFRKLYYKQFPDFEIVEAPPVEVLEAMYVVDETGELECENCDKFESEPLVDEDFVIEEII
jgi:hypothetical protein